VVVHHKVASQTLNCYILKFHVLKVQKELGITVGGGRRGEKEVGPTPSHPLSLRRKLRNSSRPLVAKVAKHTSICVRFANCQLLSSLGGGLK
jgi:hypothetical protein